MYNPRYEELRNMLLMPTEENPISHFKYFCTYLFSITKSTSILSPDLAHYLGRKEILKCQVESTNK